MPTMTITKPESVRHQLAVKWRDHSWTPRIVMRSPSQAVSTRAEWKCAKSNRVVANPVPVRRNGVNRLEAGPRQTRSYGLNPLAIHSNLRSHYFKNSS